jgi:hypothetical protein
MRELTVEPLPCIPRRGSADSDQMRPGIRPLDRLGRGAPWHVRSDAPVLGAGSVLVEEPIKLVAPNRIPQFKTFGDELTSARHRGVNSGPRCAIDRMVERSAHVFVPRVKIVCGLLVNDAGLASEICKKTRRAVRVGGGAAQARDREGKSDSRTEQIRNRPCAPCAPLKFSCNSDIHDV